MNHYRPSIVFYSIFMAICAATPVVVQGAQSTPSIKLMREGKATYRPLDATKLPAGTSPKLFAGRIVGDSFDLFIRSLDAQPLNIELGFVDVESTGPQQHNFALSANGTPLEANLDVWARAGGAYKPWVLKTTYSHSGGALSILFTGLGKPAFVSYARIMDANGKTIALGTADGEFLKGERLTLLDSRSRPFQKVAVGSVPFFNVDHSPTGSWSSLIYGMEGSGGAQVCKQPGGEGTLISHRGMVLAVKNGSTKRVMPFIAEQEPLPEGARITAKEVTRTLGACSDTWKIPLGVSWTHYTPVWNMKDWRTASADEKRRFVLPVTWMQYQLDNSSGKEETQMLFSLRQSARQAQGLEGFDGYVVDDTSTIAVKSGDAELLTEAQAKMAFGVDGATSAFCVHVAPGTRKTVTFYVAQYQEGVITQLENRPLKLMCAALFSDINDILKTAEMSLPAVITHCEQMEQKLAECGQDEERRFLAADTLHSYQYNTVLYATEKLEPVWTVIEGECSCINTFDLTVDHVFYELAVHPWTVRNELDNYSKIFSYTDELSLPGQMQRFPGGLGFWHDMGTRVNFSNREKGAAYKTLMTQEELQNWIICASLYWKTTGDNAWLEENRDMLKRALQSMQLRDDLDPAKRDGITTYISNVGERTGEITTYDAMDASLVHPNDSLYIAVKSFACYTMLQPVFQQLGETELAKEAQAAEAYTTKGILSHWDESRRFFPATFDGKSVSAIIPAVEGLAYPYAMGLTDDVSLNGPNADFISHLKTHLETILVPGVCVDAETGAWNLSSTSYTTWVSKVYLNQFIAENILGMKSQITGHDADVALHAYEVLGAPAVCWTDQIYTASHIAFGCRHYPRGVTSALWWLWQANPPAISK